MKYSAYGVCLDSEFSLAGLPTASDEVMRVGLGAGCSHPAASPTIADIVIRHKYLTILWSERPVFRLGGIGEFHLCPDESRICCCMEPKLPMEVTRYWLVNLILPFYLLLAGLLDFLHGSAVGVGKGAVAFLANSMGGKSTLANYFVQRGHSLLTDEHVGFRREKDFLVVPSAPFVRPRRQIGNLGEHVQNFASNPLPLRALYLLELGSDCAQTVPLTGAFALPEVVKFSRYLVSKRSKERFSQFAALVSTVPIVRLHVPKDLSQLPNVYETVLTHLGERNAPI